MLVEVGVVLHRERLVLAALVAEGRVALMVAQQLLEPQIPAVVVEGVALPAPERERLEVQAAQVL
jgi:hypothetical protein